MSAALSTLGLKRLWILSANGFRARPNLGHVGAFASWFAFTHFLLLTLWLSMSGLSEQTGVLDASGPVAETQK